MGPPEVEKIVRRYPTVAVVLHTVKHSCGSDHGVVIKRLSDLVKIALPELGYKEFVRGHIVGAIVVGA